MTHCLKLTGIALFWIFAGAPALSAQPQWRYEVNQYGYREAFLEQKSAVLGTDCLTRLEFNAASGDSKGHIAMLSLEFTVSPIAPIKGFDFGYFEGPDAPAGSQKLMRITVTKGGKPFVHRLSLGGWLSAEVEDGFVFNASHPTRNRRGAVRKILDQVQQGAESIEVAIIDGHNHAIALSATFPLAGSKQAIEALLKTGG